MRKRLRSGSNPLEGPEVERFVAEVGQRLVATLTVQTGDHGLAEELAQETLIRCLQHWPKVSRAERPDAWAFKVAFNLTKSRWRRQSIERRHLTSTMADRSDEPTADEGIREDVLTTRRAVGQLPPRRRAVIVCRFLLGYDVRTTANVLGCAEGTVKAQTSKGLDQLREILGVDGEPGRAAEDLSGSRSAAAGSPTTEVE